jgi:hypothetical protein
MMLEPCDYDLVALPHVTPAPSLSDEVDRFGCSSRENNIVWRTRAKEAADFFARCFVSVGCAGGKRVSAPVSVGVFVLIEQGDAVDHGLRLLRRCGIVQPNERLAMDLLVQDRKIPLDRVSIEGACAGDEIGRERWLYAGLGGG